MRETRNAQASIFDHYAAHELGSQLKTLSDSLDKQPGILTLVKQDFRVPDTANTGVCGLGVESIFRCLLLKKITGVTMKCFPFSIETRPPTAALRARYPIKSQITQGCNPPSAKSVLLRCRA